MQEFEYEAFDRNGGRISGRIVAETRDAALRQLREQGNLPIDAVARGRPGLAGALGRKLGAQRPTTAEITLFTQEVGLLLSSGQPLSRALALIEGDGDAPRIQALAGRLRAAIAGGKSLSEALALEGSVMPPFYIGMVKAGEATGQLAVVLQRVAQAREREERLRQRITSAMVYPSLLVLMAVASIVVMIVVVVPQFESLLGEQKARLPAASLSVLAASHWLTDNWRSLAVGAVGLIGLVAMLGRRPGGRRAIERVLFAVPLLGNLMRLSLTAGFCRSLGVLLASGLGLPAALALTREVMANARAREAIGQIGVALREGRDFAEPMRQSGIFPPLVTSMLRIGAESGALAESALRLAEMYEAKLDIGVTRLVSVLEPAIVLGLSIVIGFIVLTVMSAVVGIYDLTGS
ncbi:MAG: type II secretion system F family protein [Hyphomicrobiaceae bacterium]|nr:type II secretion system F family protein [Hyphomicrobiaceae bacterium]